MTNKPAAVVLLSGGLDSTVALADILRTHTVARVLTFDYGQRAAEREKKASADIAVHYGLPHQIVDLPWLAALLPKALQNAEQSLLPGDQWRSLDEEALYDIKRVWVPNRNGAFLNIAACFAEAFNATTVVFGANAEEGVSFPDNTPEFRDCLNTSLAYSTLVGVSVSTPVGNLRKDAIIALGQKLGAPFELIWSCYEGAQKPCQVCPSCLRLNEARALALEK